MSVTETIALTVGQAKQRLADMKNRLVEGDPKITAKDLASANAEIEFAELREEAAKRRQTASADRAQWEAIAALRDRLAGLDPAPVESARAAVAEALDGYLAAVVAHNATVAEISDGLGVAGTQPKQPYGPEGVTVDPYYRDAPGVGVRIGEVTGFRINPKYPIEALVQETTAAHFPHGSG